MVVHTIKSKLNTIFSKTMSRIALVLLIPVLIMLIFTLYNNIYHLNSYKQLIISNYSNELNSFLSSTEEKMNSIINSTYFTPARSDIKYVMSMSEKPSNSVAAQAMSALNYAKNSSNLIDSAILYNKSGNFVITSSGVYDADTYFNSIYAYDKYPYSYWYDFHLIGGSIKILSPATLANDTSTVTKTIVPLVVVPIETPFLHNIIVYNISMDSLLDDFNVYKFTPNTELYMIDNSTKDVFSSSLVSKTLKFNSKSLYTLNSTLRSSTDIILANGEKYLSIKSTKRSNIWGYTYILTIPYSDILRSTYKISFAVFVFMFVLCCILILYMSFGSRFLYLPWRRLATTANSLQPTEECNIPNNLEDFISDSLLNIAEANKNLKHNLMAILPLSQEKYLINILNDNCTGEESLECLSFKYDYFASVAVNITISSTFFTSESSLNAVSLSKEVRKIIHSIFSNYFITYELSGTNNILYLLLNLENDMRISEITAAINQIKNLFAADTDNIDIMFGIGNIYNGIDGLKLTHQEAMSNMIKELNSAKIQFSTASSKEYSFTTNNENVLINYLTAGHTDKAREFLNNVYENTDNISPESKRQVYIDIISTLTKVIRKKDIYISDSSSNYMLNLIKNSENLDIDKFRAYINDIIGIISEAMQTYSSKVDISSIVSYIDKHYAEDISLDELAQLYNTSAKYLSKRIKQYLNIPFKEYLTQLRIDKAKELLENTNITITELYSAVGFQNRNTFTRAFKLKTGLSATEYKNIYNKK